VIKILGGESIFFFFNKEQEFFVLSTHHLKDPSSGERSSRRHTCATK
jgi:hypothetical protein